MAAVMDDRLLDVEDARFHVDPTHTTSIDDPRDAIHAVAGLSLADRIQLCADLLCASSPEGAYVVWLAVERASMSRIALPMGSFTFYDSRLINESLNRAPADRSEQLPSEIRATTSSADVFPVDQFTLLVRIDMGVRVGSFVEQDARQCLLALLAPAERVLRDDWKVLPGSVVFRDDHDVGWRVFEDIEQTSTAFRLDVVADNWLEGAGQQLAEALPASPGTPLYRFLRLVEWDAAHRSPDSLTTILLAVRTIETVAQAHLRGMAWGQLVKLYTPPLAWSRLTSELGAQARSLLHAYHHHPDETRHARLREILLEVITHRGSLIRTKLDLFVERIPELRDLWDTDPARVGDLSRCLRLWTSRDDFENRLRVVEADISLQLERLHRLRNAAQHGGPIPDQSVSSVTAMVDQVRRQILADMLHGLIEGRSCSETLTELGLLAQERKRVLESTGLPSRALAVNLGST